MSELPDLLTVARAAVAEGAALLASTVPGEVLTKGERDYVTELDLEVQRTVQKHLNIASPHIEFLGEKSSTDRTADLAARPLWILDPIDGTSNFIHGLPLCAVSLALVREGRPTVGVIRAPFLGLEYYATEGGGAYVNDKLVTTGRARHIGDAIVSIGDYAVGSGAAAANRARFALTQNLAAVVERVRMFGSAALDLAWVAEGRTDGCVILSN